MRPAVAAAEMALPELRVPGVVVAVAPEQDLGPGLGHDRDPGAEDLEKPLLDPAVRGDPAERFVELDHAAMLATATRGGQTPPTDRGCPPRPSSSPSWSPSSRSAGVSGPPASGETVGRR